MHFHQIIHKYLLDYRNKRNSNFNFLVRQKTSIKDKKYPGGKFAHGLVFQGTEKYCFVGLSNKNAGANATKSIGIVINPTKNNSFNAHLEIVFPGETDQELIAFYKDLASKFEDISWDKKGERAWLAIGEFPENDPTLLYKWLDQNYPIIRETAIKTGIENLIPDDNLFKELQDKLEKRLISDKKPTNYWIFQGNPNVYNITKALKAEHLKSWKVASHKDKIQVGDQVIIWQTGNQAGCYALAEVTSEVGIFKEEDFEQQHYINKEGEEDSNTERVKLKITKYLADDPILWEDIKDDPIFSNFYAGTQGTNFSATEKEFNALLEWNNSEEDNSFEKTRAKLDPSIFNEYIAFVKSIIKELNLEPNDPRVVYSLRNDRLNLIVGQKYCANVYTSRKDGNFGVMATNKLSKNSEEFAGKDPQTYYSFLVNLDLDNNEKKSVMDAIGSTLNKTTKSSYYKSNDADFQNFLFGFNTNNKTEIKMETPINKILYGPPGTGKTYYLKDQLFEKYTLKETSITKEQHFETVVSGCSWWQVIAIALLDIGSSKVSDIFNNEWIQKKVSLSNSKTIRPTLWGQLQSHTINECEFVNVSNRQQPLIFNKTEDSYWEILEDQVKELVPELYDLKDSVDNYNPDPDKVIKNYSFITFHQSFAYEDFIEGIKPILPQNEAEEATDLGYTIEDGVFKQLCTKAKNDPDNRYAIFIDEINRGNVSAIFGELITLIETDKRKGAKNPMSVKLPYSKTDFSVPVNLDIYGTMNTADRSVEALDTALRRRFEFKEMMPDYSVIENEAIGGITLSEVLKTINQRIELLLDRDHTIGHSYFVNVDSPRKLANAFNNKILPLLQEYFYGDYGKIGLVLGNGFVDINDNQKINFAKFKYENANDFKTPSYQLKHMSEDTIIEAVILLLGENENVSE